MISNQETLNLSLFMAIYDIVVPKDNQLRQINDLVDFSFVYYELWRIGKRTKKNAEKNQSQKY